MIVAPVVLAFIIPGVDPYTAAKIAEAVRTLHKIEGVLAKVNGYAQMLRDGQAILNPASVIEALPIRVKIPPDLLKVYDEARRTWVLAERLRGLVRIFGGDRIDRDEWYRIMGDPVMLGSRDFTEYRDWSSVTRMNIIADRVRSGERNQKTADWLLERARLGALRSGDRGSPGFSTRIAAMASAADGTIAAETGDTLTEMLKLDNERLMDKEKARRDNARAAMAVYEDLAGKGTGSFR